MPKSIARWNSLNRPARWTAALGVSVAWLMVVALAVTKLRQTDGIIVALAGFAACVFTFALLAWSEQAALAKSGQEFDKDAPGFAERPQYATAAHHRI